MNIKYMFFVFLTMIFTNIFATDYSKIENWAALPTIKDNADWIPKNGTLKDNQANAQVDVFFIHPTTDVTGFSGNANIDNNAVNKRTDDGSIKYQASVFNESCKVYAPRYQQAVLNNFFMKNTQKSKNALNFAYQDIKQAFEYYLKNYNNGRPIIIAGHSQGSLHAQHLLQDFFDGKPLQKQLVEAYIIGYPTHENQFQFLKVSEKADTFGGYISYCTFGENPNMAESLNVYNNAVVVNPLSWTTDKLFVDASFHKGAISKKITGISAKLFGAKCGNGILEIQKPSENGFATLGFKNYHIHDYSLFYINIRENVALRIKKYLEKNTK